MKKFFVIGLALIFVLTMAGLVWAAAGPHGDYIDTTDKCKVCHDVHDAASSYRMLLQSTVYLTCNYCHDGTPARQVYTGNYSGSDHTMETTRQVPFDPGFLDTTMTCSVCHSPHDNPLRTLAPFLGDSTTTLSNRLLLANPNRNYHAGTPILNEYGATFCADCHRNRHTSPSIPGGFYNHPVNTATYYYDNVWSASGTIGLGRDNRGYRMRPTVTALLGDPICQQCHEDFRNVDVAFAATTNPTNTNFPHETIVNNLVVETGDDLCLNCHATASLP